MKSWMQGALFSAAMLGIVAVAVAGANKPGLKKMPDPKNDANGGPDIVSTGFTSQPLSPADPDGSNRKICVTVCFVGDCSAAFSGGFKFTLGTQTVRLRKDGGGWASSKNNSGLWHNDVTSSTSNGVCCLTLCATNVVLGLPNFDPDPGVPDSEFELEFKVESFDNDECTGEAKDDNGTPNDANDPNAGTSYPKVHY